MKPLPDRISIEQIRDAAKRLQGDIVRTPLIKFNHDSDREIYLKLENLQPIGSFKVRGAGNAMKQLTREQLSKGVVTASAGNMAQGVAWNARRLGIPCTVLVPDHAPETKLAAITRLGGTIIKLSFSEWWDVLCTGESIHASGTFIHPVCDAGVIAGNGTIGVEIIEDLPDVAAVLVPFGGGGLSCGIASALSSLKPDTPVYACEVETAAPFAASLAAGKPQQIEYIPSFVDGIGGKSVLPEMWSLCKNLLAGSLVVSLAEVTGAIKLLIERNRVVAEGAGAASVAAALHKKISSGKIVAVVSGGNIDLTKLTQILTAK